MKIEHFAINVADPCSMAAWYVENLGLSVARKMDAEPFTHFLTDSSGSVMLEIYNNPPDDVPDYSSLNPLQVHLAFVSEDPHADSHRLLYSGATFAEEVCLPDGSVLIMLRDPWGFAIQLCKRGLPML